MYTSLPSHLAYPIYISYRSVSPHITKLDTVPFSHLQTYFLNNEPLHCPEEPLTISLHFIFSFFFHLSFQPFTSLYFAVHIYNSLPFSSLPFTFYFLSPLLPLTGFHFPNPRFENVRVTVGSPYRPFS